MASFFKGLFTSSKKQVPKMMPQQQQQCTGNCNFGGGASHRHDHHGSASIQAIPQDAKEGDELVAVVLTVRTGSTFDDLFARVKQKAREGTRVAVYLLSNHSPAELQAAIMGGDGAGGGDAGAQMRADVAAVDPGSVVINWECCAGCSGDKFAAGDAPTTLMAALLAQGHMVMVSDFSLSALVAHWDADALGANPFKKMGEFGTQMTLRFDPVALATCDDSAQLQMLGELCAEGEAHIHAMGGTKAVAVDAAVTPASHPAGCAAGWAELQVLTIVTELGGRAPSAFTRADGELCTIGAHRGLAGHVVLRYPSGGRLLASCPHWVELSRLDVNAEQLLQVAEARYGAVYASNMRDQMNLAVDAMGGGAEGAKRAKKAFASANACNFVQQSAPAKYSSRKKKVLW